MQSSKNLILMIQERSKKWRCFSWLREYSDWKFQKTQASKLGKTWVWVYSIPPRELFTKANPRLSEIKMSCKMTVTWLQIRLKLFPEIRIYWVFLLKCRKSTIRVKSKMCNKWIVWTKRDFPLMIKSAMKQNYYNQTPKVVACQTILKNRCNWICPLKNLA